MPGQSYYSEVDEKAANFSDSESPINVDTSRMAVSRFSSSVFAKVALFSFAFGALFHFGLGSPTFVSKSVAFQNADQQSVYTQTPRWLTLPPTPKLPGNPKGHYAKVNNVSLWYADFGKKSNKNEIPLVFMHGGLSNSDYWGLQVQHFQTKHRVITIDTRGHGRSSRPADEPLSYDFFAADALALLDRLHIPKAYFIGWSDGAITSLNIAIHHPERNAGSFAFAANYNTSGTYDVTQSPVFVSFINRTAVEYKHLSPTPNDFSLFQGNVTEMWSTQPNWTESTFKSIPPTLAHKIWIVDGDKEEAVKRYQQDDMAEWIDGAGEAILPATSHFAFIQAPKLFNGAIEQWLETV